MLNCDWQIQKIDFTNINDDNDDDDDELLLWYG